MLLKSVRIEHFRCIRDQTLDLDQLTALIGPNGSGKSTILRALQCFFEGARRFSEDDFHRRQVESDVSISVTFGDLREPETELFKPYVDRQSLTIMKRFSSDASRPSGKYYASRLQNPDFAAVYDAPSAGEKRREYNQLRDGIYSSLPAWSNQAAALESLKAWELEHPAACQRRPDDGQFFGFGNVGNGNLAKFVRFVCIPAVRDASDDVAEGRSSPITKLLDFVVRNALKQHAGLEALRAEVRARYRDLVNPQSIESLSVLSTNLTTTLQRFSPRANEELLGKSLTISLYPFSKVTYSYRKTTSKHVLATLGTACSALLYLPFCSTSLLLLLLPRNVPPKSVHQPISPMGSSSQRSC
jgi:putative ATP-dependent endonuclease of the OLD family